MYKLISVDLKGDFGFFRKPDANNTINLSYNMLHKPALLGIFGAIIGLEGYKEKGKFPEYYEKLKDIKTGVAPLNHEKGNYQKTVIKYSNTVGYANNGSNYLTEEATLIKPAYRVFVLLNLDTPLESQLFEYLKDGKAEFLPYFGKNEFYIWWEEFKVYNYNVAEDFEESITIKSLFLKKDIVRQYKKDPVADMFSWDTAEVPFLYFERLPKDFDPDLFQYNLGDYVYTTFNIRNSIGLDGLFLLKDENYYVQLI